MKKAVSVIAAATVAGSLSPARSVVAQSNRGRRVARVIAWFTAMLSVLLLWGLPGNASAATSTPFAAESGREILANALVAATSLGSCTWSTTTKISGQAYSSLTNSAVKTGQQTLIIGSAWTVVRVVGGVVYVKENVTAMQEQFGVSDPKAVNHWISIPPANSNFTRFNTYIVLSSMLSEVPPAGALTTAVTTIDHQRVVGVTGRPNIHLGLASGTETVYVTLAAPHVPVEMVASDIVQGQRQTFVITYTNWGKDFHITKPFPSLAIGSTKLPH